MEISKYHQTRFFLFLRLHTLDFFYISNMHFISKLSCFISALELEWHLDSGKNLTKRAFYTGDNEKETTLMGVMDLQKGSKRCTTAMVYIRENIRDKLTPINIEMKYTLREVAPRPGQLAPLLDSYISTTVASQVSGQ